MSLLNLLKICLKRRMDLLAGLGPDKDHHGWLESIHERVFRWQLELLSRMHSRLLLVGVRARRLSRFFGA